MKRIAAVYLPLAILASVLVLGGLKLASEVFAQTPDGQEIEETNYDDGWLVSSFSSIVFEEGLWEQAEVVGDCTLYASLPEENNPASVMAFNGPSVVTRSYPGKGAVVKVCNSNLIVHLPPTSEGVIIISPADGE